MRFAIRDDDVNYHFSAEYLAECLDGVIDICPVTLAVVPWYKGNWERNVHLLEKSGVEGITQDVIEEIKSKKEIYNLSENSGLLKYLNSEVKAGRIAIAQHGIYHINEDEVIPELKKNFGIGAEFFTNRDMSRDLKKSNDYLNSLFNGGVTVFTPPQNLISDKGYEAISSIGMNVCGYLPSVKQYEVYKKHFSFLEYLTIFKHQVFHRRSRRPYPRSVRFGSSHFIEHVPLQPGSSVNEIKDAIDFVAHKNGDFVLSTHTYAFSEKMSDIDKSMKEVLIELLNYVQANHDVKFVSLNEILR